MRRCELAVCFGAAGKRIAQALEEASARTLQDLHEQACNQQESSSFIRTTSKPCKIVQARDLQSAFARCLDLAPQNSLVLLSPACSSFDEFSNMGERGRAFKALVNDYLKGM